MSARRRRSRTALRRSAFFACSLVVLSSLAAFAVASRPNLAEQSAFRAPAPSVGICVPRTLNRSAVLPGTGLAVSPLPDSYDASRHTQISLLGAPAASLIGLRVSGSLSGSHPGNLVGYSQGDGASFLPSVPFRAGETVTVRGSLRAGTGARTFAFHFVVSHADALLVAAGTAAERDPNEKQHFRSAPALLAPLLTVTARSAQTAPGLIFAAPYSGPGPSGPLIFDEAGNVVWFDPLPRGTEAANLQVQQYNGAPALSWWQGRITAQGFGQGEEIITDSSYRQIARIHAGNGLLADLHDFHVTPQGTAVLTVFDPIDCDLSSRGGPRSGAATDAIFQELDLSTGLVRREWHSLDHVALGDSYSSARSASRRWPFDYFHLNSIDQLASGRTLISARNTSALYELSTSTGQVLTRIGGRHSDVHLDRDGQTAYQHDATERPDGTISIFDNGALPKVHAQTRGLLVSIDPRSKAESVLVQYKHPQPLSSGSQGNIQTLANGDLFIGWGSEPYFSEFSAAGALLFDAHMHGSYESYRAYRFQWTGAPTGAPSIAFAAASATTPATPPSGATPATPATVYASWNGDTRTASWRVLAGATPTSLTPLASASRTGFETAIPLPAAAPFLAVQALDVSGAVLATSAAIAG